MSGKYGQEGKPSLRGGGATSLLRRVLLMAPSCPFYAFYFFVGE
jgi:hypothetical protein